MNEGKPRKAIATITMIMITAEHLVFQAKNLTAVTQIRLNYMLRVVVVGLLLLTQKVRSSDDWKFAQGHSSTLESSLKTIPLPASDVFLAL